MYKGKQGDIEDAGGKPSKQYTWKARVVVGSQIKQMLRKRVEPNINISSSKYFILGKLKGANHQTHITFSSNMHYLKQFQNTHR